MFTIKDKLGNKKGFTLLEVIISISIITIIMLIGYKIINNNIKHTKNQSIITQGQQSANLINKYLNSDLEYSKKVSSSSDGNDGYMYKIETNDNRSIKYIVKKHNGKYSLTREEDESAFDLVQNYKDFNMDKPFSINLDDDLYKISIATGYQDNYTFDIYNKVSKPILVEDIYNLDITLESEKDRNEAKITVGNDVIVVGPLKDAFKFLEIKLDFENSKINIREPYGSNVWEWEFEPISMKKLKDKYVKSSIIKFVSEGDLIVKLGNVDIKGKYNEELIENHYSDDKGPVFYLKKDKEISYIVFKLDMDNKTTVIFE